MEKARKHLDVVAGVVFHDDKVLCLQKGLTKFAYTSYKYEFPGGKIEPGETPPEALQRELLEELDLKVSVGPLLATVDYDYPDFSITLRAYACTPLGTHFELREHVAARFISRPELRSLPWAGADAAVVETLLR